MISQMSLGSVWIRWLYRVRVVPQNSSRRSNLLTGEFFGTIGTSHESVPSSTCVPVPGASSCQQVGMVFYSRFSHFASEVIRYFLINQTHYPFLGL